MAIKAHARLAVGTFLAILFPLQVFGFSLYESDKFSLSLKGYYKNLYFTSKRQATDEVFHADLNRVRTEWDATFFKILSTKVVWDNELIAGNYVPTEEFARRQTRRSEPYLDMDYELARTANLFYGQQIYRAFAKVDPGPFSLTLGRQKIDWGVMRLFSPVDFFTQLPIFDIEREERVGTTGANLNIPLGVSFRINAVYDLHPDLDQSRIGGRVTKTLGRFDLSLLGGRFLRDAIVGFDFSGDIQKMGVRGEFFYDVAGAGGNFVQAAFGIDYGFENTFYFALEYFFNGQGTNNPLTILPFPATVNRIQSVHQNFAGVQLKYDFTPLWNAALMTLVDVNGGSFFLYPETKYSLFDWLELTAGAQFPVGKTGGEFTAVPNVYYFQTQIFF